MATEQHVHRGEEGRLDRRTRFREYMRRLDPTGDPAQAVAGGLYVPPPNAVSQRIATRLELEPASSHLLVGGVGSGKTTELIAIEQMVSSIEDLHPVRVDVPHRHRLEKLKPGVLIALAAIEASAELTREREGGLQIAQDVEVELRRIADITRGHWGQDYPDEPRYPGEYWVEGVIEEPKLTDAAKALAEALVAVHSALQRKLVILLDGLDRVADLPLVGAVLSEDIPAIRRAGVGQVVVGPQILRFSPQREIEGVFETVHLHGATPVDSAEGQSFLTAVLRTRADEAILPGDSVASLVRWSGGVLRDLVSLARAAGAEAYAAASDAIQTSHVETAADRFGRDLLLGCTKEMAGRLRDLVLKRLVPPRPGRPHRDDLPSFTVATDVDQRLLMGRLIIEIPGTPVRYVPHPTVVALAHGLSSS